MEIYITCYKIHSYIPYGLHSCLTFWFYIPTHACQLHFLLELLLTKMFSSSNNWAEIANMLACFLLSPCRAIMRSCWKIHTFRCVVYLSWQMIWVSSCDLLWFSGSILFLRRIHHIRRCAEKVLIRMVFRSLDLISIFGAYEEMHLTKCTWQSSSTHMGT